MKSSVSEKGQVTIPQEIRKKLYIRPSDNVEFTVAEDGRVYLVKTEDPESGKNRFSKLRGAADVRMTTDEIMALTREEAIETMKSKAGTQFDPLVVSHFMDLLEKDGFRPRVLRKETVAKKQAHDKEKESALET